MAFTDVLGRLPRPAALETGAAAMALVAEAAIADVRGIGIDFVAVGLMCVGGLLYGTWRAAASAVYCVGLALVFTVPPQQTAMSIYVPLATVAFRAQEGARRRALVVTGFGFASAMWACRRAASPTQWFTAAALWTVFYGLAWLVGHTLFVAARQMRARHAIELSAQRRTIAAELHDNVAHELTLMVLRAESGRRSPQTAQDELAAIAHAGRKANAQLRQMMRLLQVAETIRPLPLRDAVEASRQELARLGRRLDLTIEGDLSSVGESTGDCLARVLKEMTNNMIRHGDPGHPCTVLLSVDEERIRLESGNRRATPGRPHGRGLGLDGMAQRVGMFGGHFWAGPEGDMWLVRTEIPVADQVEALGTAGS